MFYDTPEDEAARVRRVAGYLRDGGCRDVSVSPVLRMPSKSTIGIGRPFFVTVTQSNPDPPKPVIKHSVARGLRRSHSNPKAYIHSQVKSNNRRCRNAGARGVIVESEWIDLCQQHKWCCAICKASGVLLVIDHIHPIVYGGANLLYNVQPLCNICNSKKGTSLGEHRHEVELQ